MATNIIEHKVFSGLEWYPLKEWVVVGGAGGIGSYLITLLARAGVEKIIAYDYDKVELRNLGGQLYNKLHVGQYKLDALQQIINNYNTTSSTTFFKFKLENGIFFENSVFFSAFDNITARKYCFEKWVDYYNKIVEEEKDVSNFLFIDGRLSAETYQIFAVTPDKIEEYRKTLFEEGEIDELPCTAKQTAYVAQMISSRMFSLYVNFIANLKLETPLYSIPFMTDENLPAGLYFKNDNYV